MFSFFKKKSFTYPTTSEWSVAQGEHAGRPLLIRRNSSARTLEGHPDYSFRIGVAVPLKDPDENGFPKPNESEILNQIEDSLCNHLEQDQASVQVLAISTNGMREFIFYTRTPKSIDSILTQIRTNFPSYDLQSYIEQDSKWGVYAQFA